MPAEMSAEAVKLPLHCDAKNEVHSSTENNNGLPESEIAMLISHLYMLSDFLARQNVSLLYMVFITSNILK